MIDAHHLDRVYQMGHDIADGGLTILAQETVIDRGLCHSAFGSKGSHLVVSEITRMVAKGSGRRMAAHDGLAADIEGIIETLLACMAHVNQNAQTVHLVNHLFAESTHTPMGLVTL